jgi:DNA-binding SARP family transcriptional activator
MTLRFQLLGPVAATKDDGPVNIGVRKQRLVLALLLLEVNRTVTIQRLVDLTWAENPPRAAGATLCSNVSRLRTLLTSAEPDAVTIDGVGDGYRLSTDATRLDWHRFRCLVEQARAATDDVERVDLFDRALALWRGPALLTIASDDLRSRLATGLEEARLVAMEERVEARLRLGHHRELPEELSTLVNEHPERHQFAAHLMVAQCRSGRPAEALRTYQKVKGRLREDLGLDPPAQLRDLETAILLDEPHLTSSPTADRTETRPASPPVHPDESAGVAVPVPTQLPPDRRDFTDRTAELDRILGLCAGGRLPEGSVLTSIYGPPGIGKSALATRAAHLLAQHFPDGQLYIQLHGHSRDTPPVDPAEALERLLWALRGDGRAVPPHMEDRSALYRSELKHRRVLILLDDVASEAQVKPLLPGVSESRVLLTSRRLLAEIHAACPVQLDALGPGAAVTLFARAAGRPDLVEREPELCREIVDLCERLPLAIHLAAARLRHRPLWSLAHLAERLRDPGRRLAELHVGERSVAGSLSLSYQRLGDDHRDAVQRLASYPGREIDATTAARLLDRPVPVAEQLLEDLVDVNLLAASAPDRYRMRDLVRLYATQLTADVNAETRWPEYHLRDRNDFAVALQRRRLTICVNEPLS